MLCATALLVLLVSGALIWKYLQSSKGLSKHKLPPGPRGLPIIGNVLDIVRNPKFHLKLSEWARHYGSVFTIRILGQPALVVNDVPTMRKIFGSLASTGRFESVCFELMYDGRHGLLQTEGTVWLEQKNFCMKAFKQFGLGNSAQMDALILRECNYLVDWINKLLLLEPGTGGNGIQFSRILLQLSGNIIWTMASGQRMESSDCLVTCLLDKWVHSFNRATKSGVAFVSALKYVAPELSGYNEYYNISMEFRGVVKQVFEQHRQAKEAAGEEFVAKDLIDAYLMEVDKCQDETSSFFGEMGLKHSYFTIVGLLVAGSETTGTTINWLIFYLVANPSVQTKVHEEIDKVLSNGKCPTLGDRSKLPYLEALIHETLRLSAAVPYGVPHRLLEDVSYEGYLLPKGLTLFANVYHANLDPNVWDQPEEFKPERFLEGDQMQRKAKRDLVASFQEGRRMCPGEHLSKDVTFLFAAKLLQNFSFEPETDRERSEYLDPLTGFLLTPKKIGVLVRPR